MAFFFSGPHLVMDTAKIKQNIGELEALRYQRNAFIGIWACHCSSYKPPATVSHVMSVGGSRAAKQSATSLRSPHSVKQYDIKAHRVCR